MIKQISNFIERALPKGTEFSVQTSENNAFGHYSTSVAMRLAATEKRPSLEIANRIMGQIRKSDRDGFFGKIEAAIPGFINFWIAPKTLQDNVAAILKNAKSYGNLVHSKPKKVQVEFISANPTGPLTLANGRGGFLGDALSSVLQAAGFSVEREYYVNDTGNQVLTLGKSILSAGGLAPAEENFYKGGYIQKWAKAHKPALKKYQSDPMRIGKSAAKDFLAAIKTVVKTRARIKFDRWTSEESLHKKGLVKKALKLLKGTGAVYKKEGAIWLKTTNFGDDKDRVLVTGDGFPTYFLADAGHYLETKQRGFDAKINILGPDHYGYVKRIQAAAKLLGLKDSRIIVTQAIRLVRDGKEVKMSKREGAFVTFEELVHEVGVDAARFFFLLHAAETHMDFDLGLAKEKSFKNPVYYAQYAYVRALNIVRKAGKARSAKPDISLLKEPAELALMLELARLPEIIQETSADYRISRVARYASEAAKAFHNFYEHSRVLQAEGRTRDARLALVRAAAVVLGKIFDLMGISKPDKM